MAVAATAEMQLEALTTAQVVDSLVLKGDISNLTAEQRTAYYIQLCNQLGLNPASQPFAILRLQGREILYPTRGATDQLAAIHRINREIIRGPELYDLGGTKLVIAVCRATHPNGRVETATATVPLQDPVNVLMRCETKSKRRATLSILGLGMLDESELEQIPAHEKSAGTPIDVPALPSGLDRLRDELQSAETFEAVVQCWRDNVPAAARAAKDPLAVQHAARRMCLDRLEKDLMLTGLRTAFNAAAGDMPAGHRGHAAAAAAMAASANEPAEPEEPAVPPAMQALQGDILLVTTLDEAAACWRLHRTAVAGLDAAGRRLAWDALTEYVRTRLGIANAAEAVRNAIARADKRDEPPPPKGGGKRAKLGASADVEGGRADDADGPDDAAAHARAFTGRGDGPAWARHLRAANDEWHVLGGFRRRMEGFAHARVDVARREATVTEFARRRTCSLVEAACALDTFLSNRAAA
jgi:hypothetical protein